MSGLVGRLNRRVAIMRNGDGGWVSAGMWWAELRPVATLAPGVDGEALVARGRWRVTMRATADVRLGDRLRWAGPELHVLRVTRDPQQAAEVAVVGEERDDG